MTTRQIQNLLQYLGYYTIQVDGLPGPGTTAAVKAFQADNGLDADGIPGQLTQAALVDAGYQVFHPGGIPLQVRREVLQWLPGGAPGGHGPGAGRCPGALRQSHYPKQRRPVSHAQCQRRRCVQLPAPQRQGGGLRSPRTVCGHGTQLRTAPEWHPLCLRNRCKLCAYGHRVRRTQWRKS